MLWQKEVLNVTINSGSGAANSANKMKGRIEQMIIQPLDSSNVLLSNAIWDCAITDEDGYRVSYYQTITGESDDRTPLPVGSDDSEVLRFTFSNVLNSPTTMRIIIKVLEEA